MSDLMNEWEKTIDDHYPWNIKPVSRELIEKTIKALQGIDVALEYLNREGTPYVNSAIAVLENARRN